MKKLKQILFIIVLTSLITLPITSCAPTFPEKTDSYTSKVVGIEKSVDSEEPYLYVTLESGKTFKLSPYDTIAIGKIYVFTIHYAKGGFDREVTVVNFKELAN